MSEATVLVKSVELKEGTSQAGKPYKRVVVTDGNGNFASSFDTAMFEKAKPFEGQQAILETQPNGKFTDLIDVKPVPVDPMDKRGTGEYIRGQSAPTDARRMTACNAWSHAVVLAQIEIGRAPAQEWTSERVFAVANKYANEVFVDLLRKSNMLTDEDIPF